MLGGIDHHHAVLVEQALITLHQHGEVGAVLEIQPGAAVGQHIGALRGRNIERRPHAAAALAVARALGAVQIGHFPETQFGGMGAALVAA